MKRNVISEIYQIPLDYMKKYESWVYRVSGKCAIELFEYNEIDIERLLMMKSLYDIGYSTCSVEKYMRLFIGGECFKTECMKLLNIQRKKILNKIHSREQQIMKIDCLRNDIRNKT